MFLPSRRAATAGYRIDLRRTYRDWQAEVFSLIRPVYRAARGTCGVIRIRPFGALLISAEAP